ncbi:MAG: hypothetical protein SWO11_03855 [Thermodesulfobacteriota bacterium]|nr:hypothetical protein [Thermodesulfobacteriota bacterium]
MKALSDKIKKKYSQFRKVFTHLQDEPKRLIIEKTKWLNNADSPVMLMIDDLTNAWYSRNSSKVWDRGGDWGGGLDKDESTFSFLSKNLLYDFSEVKVTFFSIVGKMNQFTYHSPFTFAEPLNFNSETKSFFRKLNNNERFEVAYHGYNHGNPRETIENFVQEWKSFGSVGEACEQIRKGKEIFKNVFGKYPNGGKYGGWQYNEFADESIDRSNFLWWCRDWMPRDVRNIIRDSYYEPQLFGKNLVVALPSTVHGFYWNKKQIDTLLRKKQMVSIEEHIAPIRPDGLIQAPNVIEDINELRRLFNYLRKKNVWYATGTEIAEYFIAFSFTTIYDIKKDSFKIRYTGHVPSPILTLILDRRSLGCKSDSESVNILLPDGNELDNISCLDHKEDSFYVNIPVQNGTYRII